MTATTRRSVARVPRKSPLRVVAPPTVDGTEPRSRSRAPTAARARVRFRRLPILASSAVGVRLQADDGLRQQAGVGGKKPRRPYVRDAAVRVDRAHRADDAEAD